MKQILSKSIVLIGLMGSGKSAIGKMLSERMDLPLSDTDKMIEKEVGQEIPQIFYLFPFQLAFRLSYLYRKKEHRSLQRAFSQ